MTAPPASRRLQLWLGLALFYVTSFAVLAVFMTFFPLWLQHERGLTERQIAWVAAAMTIARTIAGPLWSQRVARSARPRQTILWLSLGSVAAFGGFLVAETIVEVLGWAFLLGCFYPPIHAVQDALTMRTARAAGFAYGRLRMTGSIAFMVAVLAVGLWLDRAPESTIYWLLLIGLLVMLASGLLLPRDRPVDAPASPVRAPIGALLGSSSFVLLLLAAALIQGSHAVYYSYSAIHWQQHGIAESTTGQLWALGVLAEIVLFFWARGGIERLRPTTMLMIGGLCAALRWLVLGSTVAEPALFAANWLHAFSFGATFLGALRAIERRVPSEQRATAQGLHGAASMGVGNVFGVLLGGYLFERSPALAYGAMALFALLGAALALRLRRRGIRDAKTAHTNAPASPE